jgi:His/Glu/Gln/Arg/opine family amino acid ABC transporter permease subunit
MADISKQRSPGLSAGLLKPKRWPRTGLVVLDKLFYVVAIAAVIWFIYYLLSFQKYLLLYTPFFFQYAGATLVIALISMVFATIFGFIGAVGRRSRFFVFRWLATVYVEVIRGTPALVQLLIWYYGIGLVLGNLGFNPYTVAFNFMTVFQSNSLVPRSDLFNAYFYGILGLSFNYGAYLTEVFRTGIENIDKGQAEAALSLGLNGGQVMRRIILPQAIRITIPPFTNYFITLIQDSSLLSIISVFELEHITIILAEPQTNANIKMFVFAFGALFYLALCFPLGRLARYLESRMAVAY